MAVDLHIHTNCSDSSFTPAEVVKKAYKIGFKTIAITDHDSINGISEASQAAKKFGIRVIPGVELSADTGKSDVHILGYFIDWKSKWLKSQLEFFRQIRLERARKIVKKLWDLGIKLNFNHVLRLAKGEAIGRLHIATALYQANLVSSVKEAFARYIDYNGPAYVEKYRLRPADAIKIILKTGGVPVLAHPCFADYDEKIPDLIKEGLKGLEVYHPDQDEDIRLYYKHLAEKHNLIVTGGSDCHGLRKGKLLLGEVRLSEDVVRKLENARLQIINNSSNIDVKEGCVATTRRKHL